MKIYFKLDLVINDTGELVEKFVYEDVYEDTTNECLVSATKKQCLFWSRNNTSFTLYDIKEATLCEVLEHVLSRKLNSADLDRIRRDWKAFYKNPMFYRDSSVAAMVNQYLDTLKEE